MVRQQRGRILASRAAREELAQPLALRGARHEHHQAPAGRDLGQAERDPVRRCVLRERVAQALERGGGERDHARRVRHERAGLVEGDVPVAPEPEQDEVGRPAGRQRAPVALDLGRRIARRAVEAVEGVLEPERADQVLDEEGVEAAPVAGRHAHQLVELEEPRAREVERPGPRAPHQLGVERHRRRAGREQQRGLRLGPQRRRDQVRGARGDGLGLGETLDLHGGGPGREDGVGGYVSPHVTPGRIGAYSMPVTRLRLARALPGVLLAACSPAMESAPTALLAPDSVVVARLESARAWDELVRALTSEGEAPRALREALAELGEAGADAEPRAELDEERPLYLGVSLDGAQRTQWTFLAPVTNGRAFRLEGGLASRVHRGYAATTSRASLPLATRATPLADELPPALLAARVDLARLVAAYRPLIDTALQRARAELERGTLLQAELLEPFLLEAPQVLDAVRSLELVLEHAGDELVVQLVLADSVVPVADGPRADLAALLARLDPEAAFLAAFNGTGAELRAQVPTLLAGLGALLPEALAAELAELRTLGELASLVQPGLALALAPGAARPHSIFLVRARQSEELAAELARRLAALAGAEGLFQLGAERSVADAGLALRVWPLALGERLVQAAVEGLGALEELRGDVGAELEVSLDALARLDRELLLALAHAGDLVLVALTTDEERLRADLRRLRDASALEAELAQLVARCAPGRLALAGRLGGRDPQALGLGFWSTAHGTEWSSGARTSLARLRAALAPR